MVKRGTLKFLFLMALGEPPGYVIYAPGQHSVRSPKSWFSSRVAKCVGIASAILVASIVVISSFNEGNSDLAQVCQPYSTNRIAFYNAVVIPFSQYYNLIDSRCLIGGSEIGIKYRSSCVRCGI